MRVTILVLLAAPLTAHADGIEIPADIVCPEGSTLDASHGAIYCQALSCESDASCGARRCEPRRVCTRGLTYTVGSRVWPPPEGYDGERHASVVIETCASDGACTGAVPHAASRSTGALDPGAAACSVQRVCVDAAAPPVATAPPSTSTAPSRSSGCSVGRSGGSWLFAALALIACARRSRAHA